MQYATTDSPVGTVHMLATEHGLAALYFDAQRADMERRFPVQERASGRGNPWLLRAEAFVSCYFAGDPDFSAKIPFDLKGSEFQQAVWGQLLAIPSGETRSYRQIADALGNPDAVRAVGAAVGQNPISLLIPCHRVVGSDGSLTGYAGGIGVKKRLLELESAATDRNAVTA